MVQCSGKGPQVQFSTVSLGLESPEVVARFAGHYLAAGAKRVTVFHDGPLPEGWPAPREGLEVIACDDAFWAAQGGRPEALEDRQAAVYAVGLARCPSPWMLAADLDEFVACYNPQNRHERTPTWSEENPDGRWRAYSYDELVARDKVNLDIFWLRDESLEDTANLPDPDVLAEEILEDLRAATEQLEEILTDLYYFDQRALLHNSTQGAVELS